VVLTGSRVGVVALAVSLSLATAADTSAQGVVVAARLAIDVLPGGDAIVTAGYRLALEAGATVPLEVLVPDGIDVVALSVTGSGPDDALVGPVRLEPASARQRTATLPGVPDDSMLALEYRVTGALAWDGHAGTVRVPVVGVALPAAESGDVFNATIRPPPGLFVTEGFPTGLTADDTGALGVLLPVVPSMVSLRGRDAPGWRLGAAQAAELLTLLVLVGFAVFGWRHLRGVAA